MQRFLLPKREGLTYAGVLQVQTLALQKVLQEFSGALFNHKRSYFQPPRKAMKKVDTDCISALLIVSSLLLFQVATGLKQQK